MFDISVLKEMKLSELQDIAKLAKTIKFNGVKKDALINEILAHQAAAEPKVEAPVAEAKPKRSRISTDKKTLNNDKSNVERF